VKGLSKSKGLNMTMSDVPKPIKLLIYMFEQTMKTDDKSHKIDEISSPDPSKKVM
jgi:hypothetical protein